MAHAVNARCKCSLDDLNKESGYSILQQDGKNKKCCSVENDRTGSRRGQDAPSLNYRTLHKSVGDMVLAREFFQMDWGFSRSQRARKSGKVHRQRILVLGLSSQFGIPPGAGGSGPAHCTSTPGKPECLRTAGCVGASVKVDTWPVL